MTSEVTFQDSPLRFTLGMYRWAVCELWRAKPLLILLLVVAASEHVSALAERHLLRGDHVYGRYDLRLPFRAESVIGDVATSLELRLGRKTTLNPSFRFPYFFTGSLACCLYLILMLVSLGPKGRGRNATLLFLFVVLASLLDTGFQYQTFSNMRALVSGNRAAGPSETLVARIAEIIGITVTSLTAAWMVGVLASAARQTLTEGGVSMARCLQELGADIRPLLGWSMAYHFARLTIWYGYDAAGHRMPWLFRWETLVHAFFGVVVSVLLMFGPAAIVLSGQSASDAIIASLAIWGVLWKKAGLFLIAGALLLFPLNLGFHLLHWQFIGHFMFDLDARWHLLWFLLNTGYWVVWGLAVLAPIRWYHLHLPQIFVEREGQTAWPVTGPA